MRSNRDIIIERFLKWLMFALFFYITDFFFAYCLYHIFRLALELDENAKRRPITEDDLTRYNLPEKLTEEDKEYFYNHPNAYIVKPGVYGEWKYRNNVYIYGYPDEISQCKNYPWVYPSEHREKENFNPRFRRCRGYTLWWNKPYWDSVDIDEIKYLENKKEWLNNQISWFLYGYRNGIPNSYTDEDKCARKELKEIYIRNAINEIGKEYAHLKEEYALYDSVREERKKYIEEEKKYIESKGINNERKNGTR